MKPFQIGPRSEAAEDITSAPCMPKIEHKASTMFGKQVALKKLEKDGKQLWSWTYLPSAFRRHHKDEGSAG